VKRRDEDVIPLILDPKPATRDTRNEAVPSHVSILQGGFVARNKINPPPNESEVKGA
jgi:hypothetical protein